MLKTLLNKQLYEIFKGYFYDAKKNKSRSKVSTALFIVSYVLLMVGILGGMFTAVSIYLCKPLASAGLGWLYFLIMGGLAIFLGAFGSVFNTFSGLYLSKDNDLMLSLPIPVKYILMSRLLGVYLMGLMFSSVVIIPAVIVYWVKVKLTVLSVVCSVWMVFLISILVLIMSCLLGWVVAKISLKLKNKSFITVIISLLFIGAYYFFYYKAQKIVKHLIENAAVYGLKIKGSAYPLYLLGRTGEGDFKAVGIVTAVLVVASVLMWIILSRSFLKIATSSGAVSKTVYKEKEFRSKSVSGALFGREMKRFTSSPNYMLNCGLGILGMIICGVVFIVKGTAIFGGLDNMFSEYEGIPTVLICTMVCMVASMNDMTAPSVSLEGKNLWLAQSLPVTPWQVLSAKLSVQLLLTAVPLVFCLTCAAFIVSCSAAELIFFMLVPVLYMFFSALFGLFLNLKMPNLTWTNEIVPIKQSASVILSLLGNWVCAIILGGGYLLFGWKIGMTGYLALFSLFITAVSIAMYTWIRKKGTKIFAEL